MENCPIFPKFCHFPVFPGASRPSSVLFPAEEGFSSLTQSISGIKTGKLEPLDKKSVCVVERRGKWITHI